MKLNDDYAGNHNDFPEETLSPMKYYILLYKLNGKRRYLIWSSDDRDSVLVDKHGFIPSFSDTKSLCRYAKGSGYLIEKEKPILHDLDRIVSWLKKPGKTVDCPDILMAWNLFSDIAASFPHRNSAFKKINKKFPNIYEKVFWGNNLPAVTPKGKSYEPIWSASELKSMIRLMTTGLDLFVNSAQEWPGSKSKRFARDGQKIPRTSA